MQRARRGRDPAMGERSWVRAPHKEGIDPRFAKARGNCEGRADDPAGVIVDADVFHEDRNHREGPPRSARLKRRRCAGITPVDFQTVPCAASDRDERGRPQGRFRGPFEIEGRADWRI